MPPWTMGSALEVHRLGAGAPPLLLVQSGLTADELLPLAREPVLDGCERLVPHRRGYAGSGPAAASPSIAGDVADCLALLDARGHERARVLGYSYSGAVALQLAADHPERVAGLVLVEPPPLLAPSVRAEFVATVEGLLAVRREAGVEAALDAFWAMLGTPAWWAALDAQLPGARDQMRQDAATFLDADLPALLAWSFGDADAARVRCPVLHVGADGSGPWWAAVRRQVRAWFPGAGDVVVAGADHGLAVTHAAEIAARIAPALSAAGRRGTPPRSSRPPAWPRAARRPSRAGTA
ncbi:alpha/beta fold hydrolase [Pimelobacter simplex]|uniref:alpha/beta fold hydrolase n=1 Tax=Nocardioides simplex TaxID=2045 RepID=UPI0013759486|nr:alpha/beta hydrolase [Pimelobacter simplex]